MGKPPLSFDINLHVQTQLWCSSFESTMLEVLTDSNLGRLPHKYSHYFESEDQPKVPILPIALGYTAGLKRPNQIVLLRWLMLAVQSLLLTGHET